MIGVRISRHFPVAECLLSWCWRFISDQNADNWASQHACLSENYNVQELLNMSFAQSLMHKRSQAMFDIWGRPSFFVQLVKTSFQVKMQWVF